MNKSHGAFYVFLAALLYSIGGLCIKFIPWNGMSINGARTAISLLVISGYLLCTRHKPLMSRSVVLGALCVFGVKLLYALANKMTTAANTIVLQFTAPIFVILLSMLFWHKRPRRLDLITCGLVLCGVACFFVDSLQVGGMAGNVLALLSGLCYAGVFLLNDMPDSDPISSVFWGDLLSAVVGLPFLLQETVFTASAVISVIILGAFQVGLAYIFMCIGLKSTPPVTASLITGIEPILNPVLVALFYGEAVGTLALPGAVIVIGSVIVYNVLQSGSREMTQ